MALMGAVALALMVCVSLFTLTFPYRPSSSVIGDGDLVMRTREYFTRDVTVIERKEPEAVPGVNLGSSGLIGFASGQTLIEPGELQKRSHASRRAFDWLAEHRDGSILVARFGAPWRAVCVETTADGMALILIAHSTSLDRDFRGWFLSRGAWRVSPVALAGDVGVLGTLVFAGWRVIRRIGGRVVRWRESRNTMSYRCRKCGYSLEDVVSIRCPECGAVFQNWRQSEYNETADGIVKAKP